MGFRFPQGVKAKKFLQRSFSNSSGTSVSSEDVPKGHLAVYVGDESEFMKRFVIPVSLLNKPSFRELLSRSEEEFGFDHPFDALTIPCSQGVFIDIVSQQHTSL